MRQSEVSKTENAPRDCGECNVCCTVMNVRPLDKPAGQHCRHQGEAGCGIYHDRPPVCREWFCMWVRDTQIFTDEHRPDRLGVFFTASAPDHHGRQTLYAHEVYPGAAGQRAVRLAIAFLSKFAPVQILQARSDARNVPVTMEGIVIDHDAA